MAEENQTEQVTELTLVGLTDNPRLQAPLFVLFLLIYLITLAGNLGMVVLIRSSTQLQSPMYFFLSHLSLLDAGYSSVVAPRTLMNLLIEKKTISLASCATQLFFFIAFGTTECFLLAAMAYDRYTAICNPLLYPLVMSHRLCVLLVAGSYVLGLLHSLVHTDFTFSLPFCQPAEVDHFYCAIMPVLALSCSDTRSLAVMAWENWTTVTEFVFKGFTDRLDLQVTLFVVFLLLYIITVLGNLGIIAVVWLSSQLQTPMYFFLSNLSFLDLCYSSAVTPKMLLNLSSERKTISFAGCFTQLYFYSAFVTVECYLLAVMAYDRYVAICNPLCYPVVMSQKVCVSLLAGSYVVGFFNSVVLTGFALRVSFCGPNVIDHFFCDGPPLSKLACSDICLNQMLLLVFGGFNGVTTVSVILISYGCILVTILKMGSAPGKRKAFGTCASHLVVVVIFYGTLLFMYLRPTSSYSLGRDKIVSVFYAVVTPVLNPFIYSLRNQEVKCALKGAVRRIIISLLKR
ncbi:olfactory receptor 1020-like isoform X1 [Accipiter gentilis]|uniref:olfactory receptor 1020-like isoform X1 n=2 Tax=Astur gentilis TaxID=8957 RepID=UPI0021106B58|nr:olfactory receptor 1020-like isoform X1 [Accipiter gentilis]